MTNLLVPILFLILAEKKFWKVEKFLKTNIVEEINCNHIFCCDFECNIIKK